ncbi:SMI1/KNR4 family protein [Planosporangium thailandense]|uniref:SMI1/KNR4 family protein n=1 Tax=Planosporangium thailandense TaxID=765197 RepID=A0ABX0Y706_9ACTN|nr:SMI1/KNR4 family protein [Planosporangium thailandense]NJC73208.1 SMI1/KNR4 family protein [Planosporangium thailandense]
MRAGFDLARELATGLDDRQAAWQFVRHFAATWLTPLAESDGWSDAELDDAERRLELRLPAALREAYGLFGRRRDLTSNQDTLLDPAELYLEPTGEALIFRVESQGFAHWGVLTADLDKPDPPVVVKLNLRNERAESWDAWLGTFSAACIEMVLSESIYARGELGDNKAQDDAEAEQLEQRYEQLALPDYPTPPVGGTAVRWFTGPDVVLRDDQQGCLWVRARTAAALERMRRNLPGYWETADHG